MPTPLEPLEIVAQGYDPGLTGTIGVTIYAFDGTVQAARSTSGITELGTTGIYRKTITTPATPGTYFIVWDAAGVQAEETLVIDAAPTVAPPPAAAAGGPCTPWITTDDLACVIPTGQEASAQEAVDAATWMLHVASGRRYRGACLVSVRPCRDGWESCWEQSLTPATWIGGHGRWDNCGCSPLATILLAGLPVRSVESVTIDGDTLAEDAYRLDPGGRLVRIDGDLWPSCQNMAAAPGGIGSFVVTYRWGRDAPQAAKNAASQLACELWAAQHNPDVCRLPANVTELVRQGVTITRAAQAFNLRSGATGLAAVDAFLGSSSAARPAVVYSPDVAPFPRTI